MSQKPSTAAPAAALDRSDERVRHDDSIGAMIKAFFDRVRSGDLGMLPVVVGLIVISTVFSILNPVFLAPNNLVNLLFDCATVGVISLGIVCVLMLGEIDLSVGSMSGLSSAILGVLWVNTGWPLPLAIAVAIVAGIVVGSLYAVLYNRLGMPSFVATLAGLLALLGIIVIQAISNGLTLLNLSSSLRYMITGAVLAIAVIVDSLARRSRVSHGRA